MDRVKVTLPHKYYEILIGDGAINLTCLKDKSFETKKILVLTDENVAKLHINKMKKVIRSEHYYEYIIKSGEDQKSLINFKNTRCSHPNFVPASRI